MMDNNNHYYTTVNAKSEIERFLCTGGDYAIIVFSNQNNNQHKWCNLIIIYRGWRLWLHYFVNFIIYSNIININLWNISTHMANNIIYICYVWL